MSRPFRLNGLPVGAIGWGTLAALLATAAALLDEPRVRTAALRGILVLAALGEALGGFFQVFRARQMAAQTGRPYAAAYHGVVQDFGFYNFAMALLLGGTAIDPARHSLVIRAVILLYVVHGGTHLLRYRGRYYAGETPIPTRSREMELRDGMPLLVAALGLALFFP